MRGMTKVGLWLIVYGLWIAAFMAVPLRSYAMSPEEEIAVLKSQVGEMMGRIEKLEKDLTEAKKKEETQEKQIVSKASLKKLTTKLNMSGRWAAGYFWSQFEGSNQGGSFLAPEAKLRFDFDPDEFNTIVMRLNLNNAAFNNVDYFYLDSKYINQYLKDLMPVTTNVRIGRFKLNFGEETWSNNPVESILPSNSAANVGGNDEGIELRADVGKENPLKLSASLSNGNSGTTDNNGQKAVTGKIAYRIIEPLYVSGSYFHSMDLRNANSEVSIGGLASAPTGAGDWSREIYEVDARYDIGKGKVIDPPAYTDSKAYIRTAYGQFRDNPKGPGTDRRGRYGFVEGLWNIHPKFYLASRYSLLDEFGEQRLSWNSITSNRYDRYQAGGGLRLTKATLLKAEYVHNEQSGTVNGAEPEDNAVNVIVSSTF